MAAELVSVGTGAALFARRNEPEVAAFQSWSLPYPREHAEAIIDAVCEMPGPADDNWWMLTLELLDTTRSSVISHFVRRRPMMR